jgi:hypothetical protein
MPSFATLLITWLRGDLKADTDVATIPFEEEPDFAAKLTSESGTATVEAGGAAFGTPSQSICGKTSAKPP